MRPRLQITYVIDSATGCWNCNSHKPDVYGYPRTVINKKQFKIHRLMYMQHKGIIPEGYVVRHNCDNRLCINPDHLQVGTIGDNNRDTVQRGRHISQTRIGIAIKLSKEQALEIFYSTSTYKVLAEKYNVNRNTICMIKTRNSWKHIHAP